MNQLLRYTSSRKDPDARFQSQYLKIQQKRKAAVECISSEAVDDLRELDVNC
ncbi:hypothetical protein F511_04259 [Dorcoceras hygrometricum]|nr:hypothetical protein F511_04259 [Dorcoceras hygrometricum]